MDKNLKRSLVCFVTVIAICSWWICSGCVSSPASLDCKQAAFDFYKELPPEAQARVIIGRIEGVKDLHARVVYSQDGKEIMVDPSWGNQMSPDWTTVKRCESPEDVFDIVLTRKGKLLEAETEK